MLSNHEYYIKNREKRLQQMREYRLANYEKCANYAKEYHATHKEKRNKNAREYYKLNKEKLLSKSKQKRNKQEYLQQYCRENLSNIENYELAKQYNFKHWVIHHRDEIKKLPSDIIVIRSRAELIENDRYFNCPANELIFLPLTNELSEKYNIPTHKMIHSKKYYK